MSLYRIKGTDKVICSCTDVIADYRKELENTGLEIKMYEIEYVGLVIDKEYIGNNYDDDGDLWEALEDVGAIEELTKEEEQEYFKNL